MDGLKSKAKKPKGPNVEAKAPKPVPVITMGSASAVIKQLAEVQVAKVPKNKRSQRITKKERKVFKKNQSKRSVVASVRRESNVVNDAKRGQPRIS